MPVRARLSSLVSGRAGPEWETAAGAQDSGGLSMLGGEPTSLGYDPKTKTFQGTMVVPPTSRITGDASVSIDGAVWTAPIGGAAIALPVDSGLDDQGRLILRTWALGQFARQKLRSTIPTREFDLIVESTGPIEVTPAAFKFNAAVTDISVGIRDKEASAAWGGLSGWFEESSPRVGSIRFNTKLRTGQIITSPPIPVVLELRPLWVRVAVALAVVGGLIWAITYMVLGRRLPTWFLVSSDATGRPISGAEPIRLHSYRRSVNLAKFGMPGAVIYKSFSGRVGVRLRGAVRMQVSGSSRHSESSKGISDSVIGIGDSLHFLRSDGSHLIFKIDVF